MDEIVTLKGIENWIALKGEGKPMRQNWRGLINNYLNGKMKFAEIHRKRLESVEADIEVAKGYYHILTDGDTWEGCK